MTWCYRLVEKKEKGGCLRERALVAARMSEIVLIDPDEASVPGQKRGLAVGYARMFISIVRHSNNSRHLLPLATRLCAHAKSSTRLPL